MFIKYFFKYSFLICMIITCLSLTDTAYALSSLPIPYTMQAPYSQWGVQPWEDACEEAAIIMVDRYYRGVRDARLSPKLASNLIMHVVNLERLHFGFDKDTNASQIASIINDYFPWEAYVVDNPTVSMLEGEIDAGRPVIIPFWGKAVKNPHFLHGGPDYHVAVIKGYDAEKKSFIVQEPGNGYGLDYRYSYATLIYAMRDFLPDNNTQYGKKVAVFTRPDIIDSAFLDADRDGLGKSEELKYGTWLWLSDTDADGHKDGYEVSHRYSPIVNEGTLKSGTLIKTNENASVYLFEPGKKQYIPNESIFIAHGWNWNDIKIVGAAFLDSLELEEHVQ